MPIVSIIMPVYNSEKYIEKTINSIIGQTYNDWELIIVDDCSTDGSFEIVNGIKDDRIKILKNEKNLGAALTRNKAIEIVSGRYIAFIDSDDYWKEDKLEKQLEYMKENDIAFSFSSYERVDEKGNVVGRVKAPKEVDFKHILKNTPIQISTVVLDTQKIDEKIIRFQELRTCEDIAFYMKILDLGIVAKGIEECLVKYQVRKNSLSSNKFINTIRRWKIYKEFKVSFANRCINISGNAIRSLKRALPTIKISRLKEILKILDFKQIFDVVLLPFIWVISLLCKPLCKKIWLIEENPNEACDNGYVFYKYLIKKNKKVNLYYVIRKKSKDYEKVSRLGKTINHGSLKHWIYYFNAEKIIVTQKYANPSLAIFHILHKYKLIKNIRIFLQHGIMMNDCKAFYYNNTNFRLFICGAKSEYEYIKNHFGYPEQNVCYTGLARFDNLDLSTKTDNKLILITPTWRKWIKNQNDFDEFIRYYYSLLENDMLIKCLEKNDIKIQLVLHKDLKKFKIKANLISKNICINHNEDVDIQKLLNKAEMLITDYSSISVDIAYRKRPIIYYQFDENRFREEHLSESFFSYKNNGFGRVITDESQLVDAIKYYIENRFKIDEMYSKRMDAFFERKDKNNCDRILKEIERI